VVADVEYESWADELRLCGGDGRLNKPSDPRAPAALDIDFVFPLPFNKLGAGPLVYVSTVPGPSEVFFMRRKAFGCDVLGVVGLVSSSLTPPESGLGGRLECRTPRGGCGNEFMLIAFLIVFPAALTPGPGGRNFCKLLVAAGVVGSVLKMLEGALNPLFGSGVVYPDVSIEVGIPPVLFLVFGIGIAGNAVVGGGAYEGLGVLGNEVVIVYMA
jgi:hypothetical protein